MINVTTPVASSSLWTGLERKKRETTRDHDDEIRSKVKIKKHRTYNFVKVFPAFFI